MAGEQVKTLVGIVLISVNTLTEKTSIRVYGLIVLPFFNNVRIPNYIESKASINSITATNFNPENFASATMESAASYIKIGLDSFYALGFNDYKIRIIGGGAKNRIWRSMVVNLLGLLFRVPMGNEATVMEAAIQTLFFVEHVADKASDIGELVDQHITIEEDNNVVPAPSRAEQWEED